MMLCLQRVFFFNCVFLSDLTDLLTRIYKYNHAVSYFCFPLLLVYMVYTVWRCTSCMYPSPPVCGVGV